MEGATPIGIQNGHIVTQNPFYNSIWATIPVDSMGMAYPLAVNFQGQNAAFLRSAHVAKTTQPNQLIAHLSTNASGIYEGVYLRDGDNFIANSTEPEVNECFTNDPGFDSNGSWNYDDSWWPWQMLCMPELYCEQSVDASIKIAVLDIGYWDIFNNPDLVGIVDPINGIENGFQSNNAIFGTGSHRYYHGLATAMVSAAIMDNNYGIAGTGAGAKLLLFKAGSDMVDDWMEAQMRGASIIVGTVHFHGCPPAQGLLDELQAGVNLMNENGVTLLFPAANGNGSNDCFSELDLIPADWEGWDNGRFRNGYVYPASLPGCISVSGVNKDRCVLATSRNCMGEYTGNNCRHSSGGQNAGYMTQNDRVNVIGPSWCVPTGITQVCENGQGTVKSFGTRNSVTTPMMAGVVAHLLTVNPCLGHDEILDIFQQSETETDWINACEQNGWAYSLSDHPPIPCAATAVDIAKDYGKYTITQPTVWNTDRFVTELIIEPGGELLIQNAEITFATTSHVNVKRNARLIADNAILKGRSCSNTNKFWRGIQVHGNSTLPQPAPNASLTNPNQAGILILRNGTRVSGVDHTFIRNYNAANWGNEMGGLIVAEDTYFEGIIRTAEFQRYGTGISGLIDNSSFKNCVFTAPQDQSTNQGLAVSIWQDNGITFEGNIFDGFEHSAIFGLDASFSVTNQNQFLNNSTGVKLLSSNMFGSSLVLDNNYFEGNWRAVDLVTGIDRRNDMIVNSNHFFQNDHALSVFGETWMYITGNAFDQSTFEGVEMAHSKTWRSEIRNNTFLSANNGIQFYGDCNGTQFLQNCFGSMTAPDVTIEQFTSLEPLARVGATQGSSTSPANNSFTNDEIDLQANGVNAVEFNYIVRPNLSTASPLVPANNLTFPGNIGYQANYMVQQGELDGISPCAEEGVIQGDILATNISSQALKQAYANYLLAEATYLNGPTAATALDLTNKQALFAHLGSSLFAQAFNNQNFNQIESVLTTVNQREAKEWLIDAAIYFEDSTKAATHLSNYLFTYGPNAFSDTREVSIALLGYNDKFSLTAVQLQKLSQVYQDNGNTERGVAGSLLDFLQIQAYSFPEMEQNSSGQSLSPPNNGVGAFQLQAAFIVAPNPVKDVLNIYAPEDWGTNKVATINLYNQTGKLCRSTKLVGESNVTISLADLVAGVYYVRIQGDSTTSTHKIIKQ